MWKGLYMVNTVGAIGVGVYGRHRTTYRDDFTFNKYHFGVFLQLFSGFGFAAVSKMPNPHYAGLLFIASIALVSFPAYSDGWRQIRDEEDSGSNNMMMRRIGIYCFMTAWAMIIFKNRGSIPFLRPPGS